MMGGGIEMMKTFRLIISLIFFFILFNCGFNRFSEGVISDTKEIFKRNKEYIYLLDFYGEVIEKKICPDCEINKYIITVKIDSISKNPLISNKQYPPYYMFINDSILDLSVNNSLFEKVEESDIIDKRSRSYTLKVNQLDIQYLSEEEYTWLP